VDAQSRVEAVFSAELLERAMLAAVCARVEPATGSIEGSQSTEGREGSSRSTEAQRLAAVYMAKKSSSRMLESEVRETEACG